MTTQTHHRGKVNYHAGLSAEDRVADHYVRRGCAVVQRRWRGQAGEIDLIVQEGERVVFVEVKKSRDFARAAQSLPMRQMHRIYAAAEEFLGTLPQGGLTPARFDVALIDAIGAIQIIENAFDGG